MIKREHRTWYYWNGAKWIPAVNLYHAIQEGRLL